jgi:cell shape-determining protein MreC
MAGTYRPNESKREEFRRYLEKGGVVDAITRLFIISFSFFKFPFFFLGSLVALYEEAEKPNNAAEFVRRFMGASGPDSAEIEALKNELMINREKAEELEKENEILKEKLQKYENGQ